MQEEITFDDLVEYGKTHGANIVNGMPWSFNFRGFTVTHENDNLYLLCLPNATLRFNRGDSLVSGGPHGLQLESEE